MSALLTQISKIKFCKVISEIMLAIYGDFCSDAARLWGNRIAWSVYWTTKEFAVRLPVEASVQTGSGTQNARSVYRVPLSRR
jgi:hypothetical protein